MEILKGFVFDIQRFGTIADKVTLNLSDITGSTEDCDLYVAAGGGTVQIGGTQGTLVKIGTYSKTTGAITFDTTTITSNGLDVVYTGNTVVKSVTDTAVTYTDSAKATYKTAEGSVKPGAASALTLAGEVLTLDTNSTLDITGTVSMKFKVSQTSTTTLQASAVFKTLNDSGTVVDTITAATTGAPVTLKVAAGGEATLNSGAVASVGSEVGVNVADSATLVVGKVTFGDVTTGYDTKGKIDNNGNITLEAATTGTSKVSTTDTTIKINGNTWTCTNPTGFNFANGADHEFLADGTITLTSGYPSVYAGVGTAAGLVTLNKSTNGLAVTGGAGVAAVVITELDKGEKFTFNNQVYEAMGSKLVKVTNATSSALVGYYTYTDVSAMKFMTGGVYQSDGATKILPATATVVNVQDAVKDSVVSYNVLGLETETADDIAFTVDAKNKKVEVKQAVGMASGSSPVINLSGAAYVVEDKSTGSDYRLTDSTTIKGTSFTTNADGGLTKASGTIAVTAGNLDIANANAAGNGVTVDVTATSTQVTYAAGVSLSKTTVKTDNGDYVITETQNTSSTATVVDEAGNITGLDAGATVTGFAKTGSETIATAGDGTFNINGTAWTVANSDGVTIGYNAGKVTGVTLDAGESVTTDAKLSGITAFSIAYPAAGSPKTFKLTKVQAGATFAYDATNGATVAAYTKGDVVQIGNTVFTVNSVGSAKDGIVIGDDNLYFLNDGDKVTVTDTTAPALKAVYEVSGKSMIKTITTGGGTTTTAYNLTDESVNAFGVTTSAIAGTGILNGTQGTTISADLGTTGAGNHKAVTSIVDGMYITADGSSTFSKDNAVGKITETDSLIKYDSLSSKAQYVSVAAAGGGNDKDWYITTGDGRDEIEFTASTNVSINGGAGDDKIKATGTGDKIVYVSSGKNNITIGAGNAKVSLGSGKDNLDATGATTGDIVVTAAGGDNYIDFGGNGNSYVTITGSSGNDTIKAANADNVVKGNGGNNTFVINGADVKVSDYTFGKDVIGLAAADLNTVGGANFTSEGKISVAGGIADISATAGSYYAATLVNSATGKDSFNAAWAKDGAAKLDTSSFSKDAHLYGNEDGANYLVSGAGKDHIYSYGDNDTVYGGTGDDSYVLAAGKTGRVVGFASNSGKDTVIRFNAKFEEGDSVKMLDGSFSNLKGAYDGTNATLKSGSAQLTFSSVTTQASGAAEFVINDKKAAVAAAGATVTVGSATYADAYIGDNSAVDFSTTDGDIYVDLSNDLASSGSGPKFVGIHTVIGGAGKSTLIGSAKDDSIVAGTGESSLYGGKGKDTLVGTSDYADTFFIGSGSGTSSIVGFQTADSDTADTFSVLNGNVTAAKLVGSTIEISSDSSKGIITSLATGSIDANSKIKVAANNFNGVAKIGAASSSNSFTFEKGVGFYGGGSSEDKLAVDSSNTENAEVWLDGSKGTAYASVDVVDFSSGSADYILAGDSSKNTVVGGSGNNSLWGGAGNSVDILESNANGTTTFFYGFGEGNDIINANGANDAVNLYNISLSDVKSGEITGTGVNVVLNDGTKLTVNTTRNVKFSLASGESYIANQSTKQWDNA